MAPPGSFQHGSEYFHTQMKMGELSIDMEGECLGMMKLRQWVTPVKTEMMIGWMMMRIWGSADWRLGFLESQSQAGREQRLRTVRRYLWQKWPGKKEEKQRNLKLAERYQQEAAKIIQSGSQGGMAPTTHMSIKSAKQLKVKKQHAEGLKTGGMSTGGAAPQQ